MDKQNELARLSTANLEPAGAASAQTPDGASQQRQKELDAALIEAVWRGKTKEALALLDQGANPAAKCPENVTALMWAAQNEALELLAALLPGSDIDAANDTGVTALMFAAYAGLDETVEALLAAGANAKAVDHNGASALHMAAIQGAVYAAIAVAPASDLDQVNALGKTAEQTAIERGHGSVAEAIAREWARREREALSEAAGSPAPESQKTRKALAL
jgi:ankyrin repeat protein